MGTDVVANNTCVPLSELMTVEIRTTSAGVPCLYACVESSDREAAAMSIACSIARRRLYDERFFQEWHCRATGQLDKALSDVDSRVLQAALHDNIGTPTEPAPDQHLLGLVAEAIWQDVVATTEVGIGIPVRVEGHDWSVTDPGGDGLTVYGADGQYCYRLWESKYHGSDEALRDTANDACRQISSRALSYLARFSLVAQHLTDDPPLATFYGRLAELWADKDPAAGVGIVIGSDSVTEEEGGGCFERMTDYFELHADQHQGHLNFVEGFRAFAESVRHILWRGCGLWTGP